MMLYNIIYKEYIGKIIVDVVLICVYPLLYSIHEVYENLQLVHDLKSMYNHLSLQNM